MGKRPKGGGAAAEAGHAEQGIADKDGDEPGEERGEARDGRVDDGDERVEFRVGFEVAQRGGPEEEAGGARTGLVGKKRRGVVLPLCQVEGGEGERQGGAEADEEEPGGEEAAPDAKRDGGPGLVPVV
jgi:hypothetical protein